ncbi:hypothetical protein ACRTEC_07755 [Janibacter indicus]
MTAPDKHDGDPRDEGAVDGIPVLLAAADEHTGIQLRPLDPDQNLTPVLGALADAVRRHLSLPADTPIGATLFEMHPGDKAIFDKSRTFGGSDGFMHAFAHDTEGHFAVNARFRKVKSTTAPPPLHPAAVAMLAAQAQAQATLDRIEVTLEQVNRSVQYLVRAECISQEARTLTSAKMVDAAWRELQEEGRLTQTTWETIAPLEHVIRSEYTTVLGQLRDLQRPMTFRDLDGARAALDIKREDISHRVTLAEYLYRALIQHKQLAVAMRAQRGEESDAAVRDALATLRELGEATEAIYRPLRSATPRPEAPSILGSLLTTGLVKRQKDIWTMEEAQDRVRMLRAAVPATLAVTRPPTQRVVDAPENQRHLSG